MEIFLILLALFFLVGIIYDGECPHCKSRNYEDIMPGVYESRKCRDCGKMHFGIDE